MTENGLLPPVLRVGAGPQRREVGIALLGEAERLRQGQRPRVRGQGGGPGEGEAHDGAGERAAHDRPGGAHHL